MSNIFTISTLSKRVGINPRTLRYYEKIGLIIPTRANNGYRHYTIQVESRLLFIKRAKMLGLTLKEIKLILEDVQSGLCPTARSNIKELLASKISEIDQQINELNALKISLNLQLQKLETNKIPVSTTNNCSCI